MELCFSRESRITGRNRSVEKSQESERRLRDPIEGRRGRSTESSSGPPFPATRLNLLAETKLGLAKRILGAAWCEACEELEGPLAPLPAMDDEAPEFPVVAYAGKMQIILRNFNQSK